MSNNNNNKPPLESKKRKSLSAPLKNKKNFIKGSILATIIASTPYFFYLYESVPDVEIWDTFLFTYNSEGWTNANIAMWALIGKVIPLLLLLIWFFTNRHWWYHAIIVPISMYSYQIIDFFKPKLTYIDEYQLVKLVPVMAIIIPTIYLIRAKMFNKINNADKTLEELEEEFRLSPKNLWGKIKQYF